jgi:peptide/nickel transport system substrate-binding protein
MTRRHTRALAASAAALVAVTLSACASSDRDSGEEGGEEATGGTFVFGATGDPAMLDPAFGSDGETFRVSR